jgi:hypothetical protein
MKKEENKMKKKLVLILSLLVMLTLACNLSSAPASQAPGNPTQGNTPQSNPIQPANTSNPQPAGTPPANPVSINEGLASLNSYKMTINYKSIGPDPSDSSTTAMEIQRSSDKDARYLHSTGTTVKAGGGDPSNTDTTMYQIGNDVCDGSGTDWTWTTQLPNQTEMTELVQNMVSLTPLIDNPTFVGPETVNGIPANHFTFKVSGLGAKSGAAVNANQGDYWLAVDGQYIVKYNLVLETSMGPSVDVIHEEFAMDLTQVNQPVNIAFPQTCLDASKVTPTP